MNPDIEFCTNQTLYLPGCEYRQTCSAEGEKGDPHAGVGLLQELSRQLLCVQAEASPAGGSYRSFPMAWDGADMAGRT